jgi:hypothetical protein
MRSWFTLCSISALLLVGAARTARAGYTTTVTTPYPGVTHTVYVDASVPVRVHVVEVDVTSQEIHLSSTMTADRGQTVSDWADCKRGTAGCTPSDVVLNGDLFAPSGYVPRGLSIGGAKPWPDAASDDPVEGWFAFGRPGDINAVQLSAPSMVEMPAQTLAVEGAVGGRALLVQQGMAMTTYDAADPTEPFRQGPRSAIGLDSGAHSLFLVAVDGDQAASLGMTAEQLAWFLTGLGVADALELDGGGSSALYIRKEGGIVNAPSDGVPRPVANHVGVKFGALPYHFSLVGLVYDTVFGDMNKLLTTATVTVDGQTATWQNTHTLYHVDNITPHYVCAHATAPGYKSATQCRQITEAEVAPPNGNNVQYLSMVMFKGTDPPPDMAKPLDMAMNKPPMPALDLSVPGATPDGGGGNAAKGGCDIAGPGGSAATGFMISLVLFVGAASNFRRRRA